MLHIGKGGEGGGEATRHATKGGKGGAEEEGGCSRARRFGMRCVGIGEVGVDLWDEEGVEREIGRNRD